MVASLSRIFINLLFKLNMKNLFKLSSLLLAGLFMLTSCEPKNDDVEVASLQLSKNTLNFDKLGGEESVAVTTNQTNWTYVSGLEGQWVTWYGRIDIETTCVEQMRNSSIYYSSEIIGLM